MGRAGMSVLRDICDEIGCRRLWTQVLALQWDISFGNSPSTRLERTQALRWFGSEDFFIVCTLLQLNGHAVLARWRDQQRRMGEGERGFLPATPSARPTQVQNVGDAV